MLFIQDAVLFFSLIFLVVWWQKKRVWSLAAEIPGFNGLPIVGVLYYFIGVKPEDLYETGLAYVRDAVSSFKCWVGPMLLFVVRDPDEIKILLNSEASFEKPPLIYKMFFEYGMLTTGGNEYKVHRKTILPLFYPKSLQGFLPDLNLCIKNFIKKFDSELTMQEQEMSPILMHFSLKATLLTLFGCEEMSDEVISKFIKDVNQYFKISSEKMYKWWLMIKPIHQLTTQYKIMMKHREGIHEFLDNLLAEMEKEYQQSASEVNKKERKFLDAFYKIRHLMTYEQVKESVLTFLVAGFDTTGKMIPAILLQLAMNPEVQEKLFKEISSFVSENDDEISDETLNKMKYLDLVIKESGRMMPSILMFGRELSEDVKLPKYTVPAGTIALFLPLELHMDESIWGHDARDFKPERFTEENLQHVHPSAYILFSRGPRMCVGYKYAILSMKAFLSKFLLKYHVSTRLKYDELKFQTNLSMMVEPGFLVKVERR